MQSVKAKLVSLVLGLGALGASLILLLEKIELWKNPDYVPTCSWNPLFSCQGPMNSWQSSALGVPNPIIGLIGYTIVVSVLVLGLNAELPRWVWVSYTAGVGLALGYLGWLMTQSLYVIGALCVYCMVVWFTTIPLFWIALGETVKSYAQEGSNWLYLSRGVPALIAGTCVLVVLLVFVQFQDAFMMMLNTGF